jgi:hypothetical protein
MKQQIDGFTKAHDKTYFVNLFTGDIKCNDFAAAKLHFPKLAKIAETLTPEQLQYLTSKIEDIL